ncbi:MAG: PKD domain-containing protein [Candidatus Bathyarchaeota archaeon]|nr:PKD domain-containing protein [Candidatus Bathyarchaeum sp.]
MMLTAMGDALKNRRYSVMFVFLFTLLLIAPSIQTVKAQTSPSVRYVGLEGMNGSEGTVIWSVFTVSQWADKINFRVWVIRETEPIPVGNWSIGLSEKLDQGSAQIMPGFGIQGVYGGNVSIHQVTAESPFMSEQRTHPIDGLRTYYFYKSHVGFDFTFEDDDIILLAADYENSVEYYEGELPYYGAYNTGDYYKIEYANIPNEGESLPQDDNVQLLTPKFVYSPSMPYIDAEITFDASESSGYSNIVNYTWDFGDYNITSSSTPIVIHTYTATGSYCVTLTITDEDGFTNNVSSNVTVSQDFAVPVTVDDYNGLWHTSDITITLTATDQESGVAETYYKINGEPTRTVRSDGQPVITTEGPSNTLEYWSVDNSGKEESHKLVEEIKLDKSHPASLINLNGVVGNEGWFTSDVTVTVYASDAISEVDRIEYSLDNQVWNTYSTPVTIASEGNLLIYYRSVDKAGNVEDTKTETCKLDKTAPVGSVAINENTAYVNSVYVTLTLSTYDPASGVSQMRFTNDRTEWSSWETYSSSKSWRLLMGDGIKTVYVQFMDNAGLVSDEYKDSITVDTIEPKTDAGSDQTVSVDTDVTFTARRSSDTSGLVSYEWDFGNGATGTGQELTYQYSAEGKYTVTLTVQDSAGNTGTTQIRVTVASTGVPSWLIGAVVGISIISLAVLIWKRRKRASNNYGSI